MEHLWTVKRFAAWKYGVEDPSAAQCNTVRRMCQNGALPCCKVGMEWRIDTAEILRGVRRG